MPLLATIGGISKLSGLCKMMEIFKFMVSKGRQSMPKQAFLTCSCGQKITITPSKRIQEIYDFSVKCACGINYGLMVWPHRLAGAT